MFKKLITIFVGLIVGFGIGFFIPQLFSEATTVIKLTTPSTTTQTVSSKVIGFLPYWLLNKAKTDYSSSITTLTYFGLQVDTDGTILRMNNPQELESGWYALQSGKVDPFLEQAKKDGVKLSLLIFSGDASTIEELVSDPIPHAQALVRDVEPVMQEYGFTDLNIDIEAIEDSSPEARLHFTQFIEEIRKNLAADHTLTVETTSIDILAQRMIDPGEIAKFADYIVIMAYDYHSPSSMVTGPVAPLAGVGTSSEFDVQTAVRLAKDKIPENKIILGIPLYGYEWESLYDFPRAAIIRGSGVLASSERVEALLSSCTNCSLHEDSEAEEAYITYFDEQTQVYHQIFYPTKASTESKVSLVEEQKLGGVALWALGYEGKDVMQPLAQYKK